LPARPQVSKSTKLPLTPLADRILEAVLPACTASARLLGSALVDLLELLDDVDELLFFELLLDEEFVEALEALDDF